MFDPGSSSKPVLPSVSEERNGPFSAPYLQLYDMLKGKTITQNFTVCDIMGCDELNYCLFSAVQWNKVQFSSCLLIQGLLSMDRIPVIIRFLPVLLNQLFKVLTVNDSDDVTTATTRYGVELQPGL